MVAVVLTINCLNDSIILGETSLDVLIAQGIQLTTKDFVQYRGVCFCSLLVTMKISKFRAQHPNASEVCVVPEVMRMGNQRKGTTNNRVC